MGGATAAGCTDEDHDGPGAFDLGKCRLLTEAGAEAALVDELRGRPLGEASRRTFLPRRRSLSPKQGRMTMFGYQNVRDCKKTLEEEFNWGDSFVREIAVVSLAGSARMVIQAVKNGRPVVLDFVFESVEYAVYEDVENFDLHFDVSASYRTTLCFYRRDGWESPSISARDVYVRWSTDADE
ncbi:MAG: hypothetical protein ACRDD1_09175, partial [Planctomycetia bacterium]